MSRYERRRSNEDTGRGRSRRYEEDDRVSSRGSSRRDERYERNERNEDRGRGSSSRGRDDRDGRTEPREISALRKALGSIDSDMKGAMMTILSNHRKKIDKKEILEQIKNVNTDGCTLQVSYDEKIQMCPSFAVVAGGSRKGRHSGDSYGGNLEYNGKNISKDKNIYDKTPLETKFDVIIDVFCDIKKLLEFEVENGKDVKVTSRNSTVSIIDGVLVLTPSMMLLNNLKDDIKKLSI